MIPLLGVWHDAWTGASVTGPKTIQTALLPYEQQPMWHRDGSLFVMTDKPGLRVSDQDWSELVLDVFPSHSAIETRRSVFALNTSVRTNIIMTTDGTGRMQVSITQAEDQSPRSWVLCRP